MIGNAVRTTAFQEAGYQDIGVQKDGDEYGRCHGSPEKPGCGRRVHKGKNKGADIHAGK